MNKKKPLCRKKKKKKNFLPGQYIVLTVPYRYATTDSPGFFSSELLCMSSAHVGWLVLRKAVKAKYF